MEIINDNKESVYAQNFLLNKNTPEQINNKNATPPSTVIIPGKEFELQDIV
jgi:hypothetical protein